MESRLEMRDRDLGCQTGTWDEEMGRGLKKGDREEGERRWEEEK